MYCSSCGVAVAQKLSYCNHCGANLNRGDSAASSEVRPDWLVFMMAATFIFGIVAITILMGVMKSVLEMRVGQIMGVTVFAFLLMLLLEGVFIRLLLRRRHEVDERKTLSNGQITNELTEARERLLSQPAASVTEHTTRAFDPIPVERKQK
jgi:Na+-transporting methylmalonyl-CoA/oxaloacetate decarboxylase gamma subunit